MIHIVISKITDKTAKITLKIRYLFIRSPSFLLLYSLPCLSVLIQHCYDYPYPWGIAMFTVTHMTFQWLTVRNKRVNLFGKWLLLPPCFSLLTLISGGFLINIITHYSGLFAPCLYVGRRFYLLPFLRFLCSSPHYFRLFCLSSEKMSTRIVATQNKSAIPEPFKVIVEDWL